MADAVRQFVIAPKLDARASVPPDWQRQIEARRGVERLGGGRDQMQVRATAEAAAALARDFGDLFHIEPTAGRDPAA